eukprot:357663-Chlamydomonas_euryale.AAC.11
MNTNSLPPLQQRRNAGCGACGGALGANMSSSAHPVSDLDAAPAPILDGRRRRRGRVGHSTRGVNRAGGEAPGHKVQRIVLRLGTRVGVPSSAAPSCRLNGQGALVSEWAFCRTARQESRLRTPFAGDRAHVEPTARETAQGEESR